MEGGMEKADQADIESIKKKQKTMTTIKPSLNYAHTHARARIKSVLARGWEGV